VTVWSSSMCIALQVSLNYPDQRQHHFSRRCLREEFFLGAGSMSWNAAILCVFSSFQVGSSRPSFYLQSLCASGSRHRLFRIVAKVATNTAKGFFFSRGIQALAKHWRTCIEHDWDHAEKLQSCTEPICIKLVGKNKLISSFDPPSQFFEHESNNFESYHCDSFYTCAYYFAETTRTRYSLGFKNNKISIYVYLNPLSCKRER
jgi:hypothetical protein